MAEVVVTRQVDRDADRMWALLGDFANLDAIAPPVAKCACESNAVGAVRTLTLHDGSKVVEELEEQDDARRRQRYVMLEGPLPLQNYAGTIQVDPAGPGACTVTWTATYAPDAGAEKMLEGVLLSLYNGTIDKAAKKA